MTIKFLPVEMIVSEFWNGREATICMGQRNGTVTFKQALSYGDGVGSTAVYLF